MKTKEFIRQKNNHGALLNVDYEGLERYKIKKKTEATLKNQQEKISNLEASLEELKGLLNKILETGNNK